VKKFTAQHHAMLSFWQLANASTGTTDIMTVFDPAIPFTWIT
jgi:hypothetical protein